MFHPLQLGIYSSAGGNAWDISKASYASKSVAVNSQDSDPVSVTFGDSGTKAYINGSANNKIFQYTLSTAWDISTATYASKSLDYSSEGTVSGGHAWKTDGSKVYVSEKLTNRVYQYDLTVNWDISTASYASKSADVNSEAPEAYGVAFSSDGTVMVVGDNVSATLYEYSLSTAWDVSTASYASVSFSTSALTTGPLDIHFRPNGEDLYIMSKVGGEAVQFTLSTGWDISTASATTNTLDVSSEDSAPNGVALSDDGYDVYMCGTTANESIYQYSITT